MGVKLGGLVSKEEISLEEMAGKKVAIDAYNALYQFLSIIRDRKTGEPLKDSKGRITSHLSGLFYRTANLIENGIKPAYVFDGEPPSFKKNTIEEREKFRKEARKKWERAIEMGEEAIKYAQAASFLTEEMVESSKKLLKLMGVPFIQAKSEGEAQCAYMCIKGDVDMVGSQDYDSLLFGAPLLVRNLSITGRRKLPGKDVYIEIKPEIVSLEKTLRSLGIDRKKLIALALLIGTDYNSGVEGIGPKKALSLVKDARRPEEVFEKVEWNDEVDPKTLMNFFISPPVKEKYELEWKEPGEKLIDFMVVEHDFSEERVRKVVERIKEKLRSGLQSKLTGWI